MGHNLNTWFQLNNRPAYGALGLGGPHKNTAVVTAVERSQDRGDLALSPAAAVTGSDFEKFT